MAGTLKSNAVQLGDSATATQNFVWQTNVDGTAKLARGNVGATTQDILTVDASGRVAMPQTVVAFKAASTTSMSVVSGVNTEITGYTKTIDTTAAFNNATGRFTPQVAGYYQVNASLYANSAGVLGAGLIIEKNGAASGGASAFSNSVQNIVPNVSQSDIVYMNGTTDYLSVFGACHGGSSGWVVGVTGFTAILIAKV